MKNLTFKKFRKSNIKRCEADIYPLDAWNCYEYGMALGETGELLNWLKKLRRLDDVKPYNKEKREQILQKEISKESCDIVSYLDLTLARLGISLEKSIIQKFNEVSDRYNSKIKL